MAVANQQTKTIVVGVTLSLTEVEATLLRNLLGGLKLKTRRGAIRKNGGTPEQAKLGAAVATDVWKALDALGFKKFGPAVEPVGEGEGESFEDEDPGFDDDGGDSYAEY
jgi:hypothetical protein